MADLLYIIFLIIDVVFIGFASFYIIKGFFGDGPLGRILAVLGCIICAVLYGSLFGWANDYCESMFWASIIILGPVGFILLTLLLKYAFGGDKKE